MAHWEDVEILSPRPKELILYKILIDIKIDDFIIIWKGDAASFDTFKEKMNRNDKNIKLMWTLSNECITFLEIFKEGGRLFTRNHFKPTDRNSYLPVDSYHHKPWLINIPKGQFMRIRRNCSKEGDFLKQSEILTSRFREKGYDMRKVEKDKIKVLNMNRDILLSEIKQERFRRKFIVILYFNIQFRQVEKIIKKHWDI